MYIKCSFKSVSLFEAKRYPDIAYSETIFTEYLRLNIRITQLDFCKLSVRLEARQNVLA